MNIIPASNSDSLPSMGASARRKELIVYGSQYDKSQILNMTEKEQRINRLKEVRKQESLISRQKNGVEYRKQLERVKSEEETYKQYLAFEEKKQQLIDLQNQKMFEKEMYQKSIKDAEIYRVEQIRLQKEKIEKEANDKENAQMRGSQALGRVQKERTLAQIEEEDLTKIKKKQEIRSIESRIAHEQAEKF